MAFQYHFAAGSRDKLTVYIVDEVLDSENNVVEETEVNLDGKTVTLRMHHLTLGTIINKTMVNRTQTGDDIGKADYQFGDAELKEGEYKCQIILTGGDSYPHIQPGTFAIKVSEALAAS